MAADDQLDAHFEIQNRRKAGKTERFYVDLQPGETTLAHMASRIYAARLGAGVIAAGEEDVAIRKAVMEAMRIAQLVEHSVEDAEEGKPRT